MRRDAKCGLAIGAAIVACAAPWAIVAEHLSPRPESLAKLLATVPATQPAEADAAIAVRYYRDRAGNLFQHTSAASVLVARRGAFVTCLIRHGRAYAIMEDKMRRDSSVVILRCTANGSLIDKIRITDEILDLATSLDRIISSPTGRFFIEAELNPSDGIGIDAGPCDHHCFVGCNFTWDATGRSIAYFWNPPGAPPNISSTVYVNSRIIRHIPQGSGEKLHWESDGKTLDVKIDGSRIFRLNGRDASAIRNQAR